MDLQWTLPWTLKRHYTKVITDNPRPNKDLKKNDPASNGHPELGLAQGTLRDGNFPQAGRVIEDAEPGVNGRDGPAAPRAAGCHGPAD